ncbi:MAG: hypothetical protein MUQ00_14605 [Candidatus Aminicenantes bacterium]|nr:hypothetical protein [Candidatus Aminicenantes bacterium]
MTLRISADEERPVGKRTAMKNTALWILAGLISIGSAVYQRMTGPTYPARGKAAIGAEAVSYRLSRSEETVRDCEVKVKIPDPAVSGRLEFKILESPGRPLSLPMERRGDLLLGSLPKQPPAGKLEYRVLLSRDGRETSLAGEKPLIIRFKGVVSAFILIPHILIMFTGMVFATKAGLEAAVRGGRPRRPALWAFGLLFTGGMILGPVVQKLAFGDFWTGFPFGHDLTDNKTLFSIALWIAALVVGRKDKPARGWILAAAIVTLAIYLIPHSLLGS